jgi:hypothetical protein
MSSLEQGHEQQHRHGEQRQHDGGRVGPRQVEGLEAVLDEERQRLGP